MENKKISRCPQWLRIHLAMQGTLIRSLVAKIPHKGQVTHVPPTTEPALWSPQAASAEAHTLQGPALREKLLRRAALETGQPPLSTQN